jgi:hypothetical protein
MWLTCTHGHAHHAHKRSLRTLPPDKRSLHRSQVPSPPLAPVAAVRLASMICLVLARRRRPAASLPSLPTAAPTRSPHSPNRRLRPPRPRVHRLRRAAAAPPRTLPLEAPQQRMPRAPSRRRMRSERRSCTAARPSAAVPRPTEALPASETRALPIERRGCADLASTSLSVGRGHVKCVPHPGATSASVTSKHRQ